MPHHYAFTLDSLLETHDLPFQIIDTSLTVVGVNKAWKNRFGNTREPLIGAPCCADNSDCRHRMLFQRLEPYAGSFPDPAAPAQQSLRVRGFPLLDVDGKVYAGETVLSSHQSQTTGGGGICMVGTSPIFAELEQRLKQAANSWVPVLLTGETGTGKELAAGFIHAHSQNATRDLVVVDCTVLADDLFESELFGHEKGAFTGAGQSKKGLFELADNSTLFLDEIGELPLSLQPKLLRALESGQFRRVGGTALLSARVRVVCATHRNLADMVKAGRFREDLYYRLSVFPLRIPPLRERRQDIPVLVKHLAGQLSQQTGIDYRFSQAAMIKLLQHNWPGNIRELRNCVQLAASLASDGGINEQDIHIQQTPVHPTVSDERQLPGSSAPTGSPLNPLDQIEADFINGLIVKHNGNRKQVAAEMNVSERTLYRKLSRLNLN